MKNKLFGFYVMIISILTINLITEKINAYLMNYKGLTHPLKFTLIGMFMMVVILVPAFQYLDGIVKNITMKLFRKGGSAFKQIMLMTSVFLLLFAILFWVYAKNWYNIDVIQYAFNQLMR